MAYWLTRSRTETGVPTSTPRVRNSLRLIWTHGVETLLLLPLVLVFGVLWGAAGAAAAVLVGMCAFAAVWTVVFVRIRAEDVGRPAPLEEALADTEAEAGALLR